MYTIIAVTVVFVLLGLCMCKFDFQAALPGLCVMGIISGVLIAFIVGSIANMTGPYRLVDTKVLTRIDLTSQDYPSLSMYVLFMEKESKIMYSTINEDGYANVNIEPRSSVALHIVDDGVEPHINIYTRTNTEKFANWAIDFTDGYEYTLYVPQGTIGIQTK